MCRRREWIETADGAVDVSGRGCEGRASLKTGRWRWQKTGCTAARCDLEWCQGHAVTAGRGYVTVRAAGGWSGLMGGVRWVRGSRLSERTGSLGAGQRGTADDPEATARRDQDQGKHRQRQQPQVRPVSSLSEPTNCLLCCSTALPHRARLLSLCTLVVKTLTSHGMY